MPEHYDMNLDYVVHRTRYYGWKVGPRKIKNYELVLVLDGIGELQLDGKTQEVRRGDLICVRPGVMHGLGVPDATHLEFYAVNFTLPEGETEFPVPDHCRIETLNKIEAMLAHLCEVNRQKEYLYEWSQNILLETLLHEIFCTMRREAALSEHGRVERALDYIHRDPYRQFTLEELIDCADVKKTMFMQAFRKVTGTSPIQYIRNLRLDHARVLLLETETPVAEVGEQCGFADPFYFSRCFRKRFGLSPQQYRKDCISL